MTGSKGKKFFMRLDFVSNFHQNESVERIRETMQMKHEYNESFMIFHNKTVINCRENYNKSLSKHKLKRLLRDEHFYLSCFSSWLVVSL